MVTYMIAIDVCPLVPSASIISRVFQPEFFGKLNANAISKSALSGHIGNDELVSEVHLYPFAAWVDQIELFGRTPGAARNLLVKPVKNLNDININ